MTTITRAPDLRRQVYDLLRDKFSSGGYPPETRLVESSVANELGVSRTPVREALALLAHNGFLVQDERGYRVPRFMPEDIEEVFELRLQLEPYAARKVAAEASRADLRRLHLAAEQARAAEADGAAYMKANCKVREELFALCGNARLRETITLFEDHIQWIRGKTLSRAKHRRASVEGLEKLLAALDAGDPDQAEQAMRALLGEARKAALEEIGADQDSGVAG